LSHTPPQRASNDAEVIERLTPVHERLNKELTKWPKKSPKHKEAKDALRWVRPHWRGGKALTEDMKS
jgi:hypothetical protein